MHEFDSFIEKSKTLAFLVIKNDAILCEKLWELYIYCPKGKQGRLFILRTGVKGETAPKGCL